ncbi:hypothetical protein GCM10023262_11540 [Bartonella pachyuromydis]|uniref:Uncharacterized protein n=1 Tax=Bartonella pachyuromydis TaxID=931097 RepID=A0ABP8VIL4_9HYPH
MDAMLYSQHDNTMLVIARYWGIGSYTVILMLYMRIMTLRYINRINGEYDEN